MKGVQKKKIIIGMLCIVLLLGAVSFFVKQTHQQLKEEKIPATVFQLEDQFGTVHSLAEYQGKVVFLNFWASWCPSCMEEMSSITELYQEYGENTGDVIILSIVNPRTEEHSTGVDLSLEKLQQFVKEKNYPFPVLFDKTGETFQEYFIQAFPTTYFINEKGEVHGYILGALRKEDMKSFIYNTWKNKVSR
ncbi:MAG TPA: TlpA disulfide reductase family protein [Fusobacterium sp.]|uniref:TlpA family protein disulfide reductase n=1 Tax=Fusobacterium sp. TaxID=68766 RepID=UPI002F41CD84